MFYETMKTDIYYTAAAIQLRWRWMKVTKRISRVGRSSSVGIKYSVYSCGLDGRNCLVWTGS